MKENNYLINIANEAKNTGSGRLFDGQTQPEELEKLHEKDREVITEGGVILIDFTGNITRRRKKGVSK